MRESAEEPATVRPSSTPMVSATLMGEALEHASEGALVAYEEGEIVAANLAASTVLGYEREELIGKNLSALLSPAAKRSAW